MLTFLYALVIAVSLVLFVTAVSLFTARKEREREARWSLMTKVPVSRGSSDRRYGSGDDLDDDEIADELAELMLTAALVDEMLDNDEQGEVRYEAVHAESAPNFDPLPEPSLPEGETLTKSSISFAGGVPSYGYESSPSYDSGGGFDGGGCSGD